MKKVILIFLLALFLVFSTNSCIPDDQDGPDPNEEIVFPDPGLDACIRDRLKNYDQPIYYEDLQGIIHLGYCGGLEIEDLSGIEKIPGLRSLDLGSNEIKDITPLSKCTTLEKLNLSFNEIEDASSLSALVNLRYQFCPKHVIIGRTIWLGKQNFRYFTS